MPEFPGLHQTLGTPKPLPFPGVIVCDSCQDRPCCCCPVCGAALGICGDSCPAADQRVAKPRFAPDVAAATDLIRSDVAWLVAWNDQHKVSADIRMLKISEEYGEATDAYLGYMGANPRKGVTNGIEAVWLELADTALAALVAMASLGGDPQSELLNRIAFVRARLESVDA